MSGQLVAICDRCIPDPYKLGYTVYSAKGKESNKKETTCIICGNKTHQMGYICSVNGGKFNLAIIH